jgi:hypothetical protein
MEGGSSGGRQTAAEWMVAFGESFVMLAAAGLPDVHPDAVSEREEDARSAEASGDLRPRRGGAECREQGTAGNVVAAGSGEDRSENVKRTPEW